MQPPPLPFFREAGAGPGVVCLHSNASSSSQWRALMQSLAPRFHVLAPDMHGAGKGPPWPSDRVLALADEIELLQPVFDRAGDRLVLVGHSYGGAVALVAAVRQAPRVRAVVVYEPTLFSLVEAITPRPNGVDGIRQAVEHSGAALDAGDADGAARQFIDYWMGPGAWDATPAERRPAIAAAVVNARDWGRSLFTEPTPLDAFAQLDVPVLYLTGAQSPRSAHAVTEVLLPALRNVAHVQFEGLGHMAPITHPDRVDAAIERFLGELP